MTTLNDVFEPTLPRVTAPWVAVIADNTRGKTRRGAFKGRGRGGRGFLFLVEEGAWSSVFPARVVEDVGVVGRKFRGLVSSFHPRGDV